jgi:hypothetical protein
VLLVNMFLEMRWGGASKLAILAFPISIVTPLMIATFAAR